MKLLATKLHPELTEHRYNGLFGNPSFNVSKQPKIIRPPRKDSNTRETKTTEKEIWSTQRVHGKKKIETKLPLVASEIR